MDLLVAENSVDFAHADTVPLVGVAQWATDGDPIAGIPRTIWPASAFNGIMMELRNTIQAAGIVLDRTNNTQLLAAIRELIQHETGNYAPDTGAANAYVIAPNPPVDAYTDGLPLRFLIAHTNTGASTVNVSGLGAKTIVRDDGSALVAGDLPVNGIAAILYVLSVDKFFLISTVQASATTLQLQTGNYAADTGADGTHFACTLAPALAAHSIGTPIRIKAAHNCTGASVFNPGPGALAITDMNGGALNNGAFTAGSILELKYDGAAYQLARAVPATGAEVQALTDPNKYVTPATLKAGRFKSGLSAALATSQVSTFAHGLPSAPLTGYAVLVCQANDNGYLAGEMVAAPAGMDTTTNRGVTVAWGGASIIAVVGSGGISTNPKGGGAANALTLANWKLYVIAEL